MLGRQRQGTGCATHHSHGNVVFILAALVRWQDEASDIDELWLPISPPIE
jgi:hypothetical protein